MKKVVILGAGISGLAAGWFLKQKWGADLELEILEKKERPGGWIHTAQKEGFLFEQGPRGFRPAGKGLQTLQLVKELGLESALVPADDQAKTRYLCLNNELKALSPGLLFKVGLIGGILRDLRTKKSELSDESIAHFCRRRFGNKLTETLIDPMVKGIFGGNAEALSVRSCFPRLWELEQRYGSILKGFLKNRKKKQKPPTALYSFKEGMEMFPKALAAQLPIRYNRSVDAIDAIDADLIISALPGHALAPLIGMRDPLAYATLSLVSMGWEESVLNKRGFGFLVPSKEKREILGMTFDSAIFPDHNRGTQTRLCTMIGREHPKEKLHALALSAAEEIVGICTPPAVVSISIAKAAIPQYTVGHFADLEQYHQALPPRLKLLGNSFHGIGINDCIAAAKTLVTSMK